MRKQLSFSLSLALILVLTQCVLCAEAGAQDLEPRRWSHLPTGLNVMGLAAGWNDGDILFDPVLRIEDATYDLYVGGAGYVRSFEFLGKSSRIDFNLPYASGRWEGLVDGVDTVVRRRGFADPRIRFSVNLYGAPPLSGKAFARYRQENQVTTTIGAALAVTLPLGDYNDQKLINLGGNRFVLRPQLGVLHQRYKWQFEATGSVFLHQDNDEFWAGNKLEQDPLWFVQGHAIYSFKPGLWASVSGGFAYGGRSHVNGIRKEDDRRTRYLAVSFGVPINARQSLKFTYLASNTNIAIGADLNALIVAWSINWGM